MILSTSGLTFVDWAFVVMMALSFVLGTILIPTIIVIFKTGRKVYFNQLRLLIKINRGIDLCYSVESYQQHNYTYPNRQSKTHGFLETTYFYPIFESDKKLTMIQKKKESYKIFIVENTKVDDSWSSESHEIKTINCIFIQLLNDKVRKKMDKLSDVSTTYENVGKLSDFINNELSSIKRDLLIEKILNK
jgi:hypothetical protein